MNIRRWWQSIRTLPSWGSRLQALMTPTIGILAGTLPVVPTLQWSADEETAYADRKRNRIVVGTKVLALNSMDRLNPAATKEEAVEAILGFVVHEGMHFYYSPDDCVALLNAGIPVSSITCTVANVIEDLFIEHKAPTHDANYGWMISAAWEYLWPEESIEGMIAETWDGVNTEDVEAIIKTMIIWKNQNHIFSFRSEFERNLYELCTSVFKMNNVQERKDLIEKIIRLLISEEKLEEMENKEQNGEGEGEGEEKGEVFNSKGEVVIAKAGAAERGEVISRAREVKFIDAGAAQDVPYIIIPVKEHAQKIVVSDNKKWSILSRWVQDAGSVRTHRGQPGNYGRLTHPGRLYDDGKIFSKVERSAPSGRIAEGGTPQTIFLLDFSGSMRVHVARTHETKYNATLQVAAGACSALIRSKHRLSVYGHSTEWVDDKERAVVYRIKAANETEDAMLRRLRTLQEKCTLYNNADATAIEAVAQTFKFDGSPMRLFVVSDGQPACDTYSGYTGIQITKSVVDGLRAKGIEVYSLSIDAVAIDSNNEIYGEKNNFNVVDPRVADKVLKGVLGRN